MNLYEISAAIRQLTETDDGELSPNIEAQLDDLAIALEDKAQSICVIIREQETEATGLASEIARLTSRVKAANRTVERLKTYLRNEMERAGVPKLQTSLFKIRVQNNPLSLLFTGDADLLPVEFKRITVEPDRKAAIEHYKTTGELLDGFAVTTGTHLRIY